MIPCKGCLLYTSCGDDDNLAYKMYEYIKSFPSKLNLDLDLDLSLIHIYYGYKYNKGESQRVCKWYTWDYAQKNSIGGF